MRKTDSHTGIRGAVRNVVVTVSAVSQGNSLLAEHVSVDKIYRRSRYLTAFIRGRFRTVPRTCLINCDCHGRRLYFHQLMQTMVRASVKQYAFGARARMRPCVYPCVRPVGLNRRGCRVRLTPNICRYDWCNESYLTRIQLSHLHMGATGAPSSRLHTCTRNLRILHQHLSAYTDKRG